MKGGVCFVTAKHLCHYSVKVCSGALHPVDHSLGCSTHGDLCAEFGQGQEPMDSTKPVESICGGSDELLGASGIGGGDGGGSSGNNCNIGGCGGGSGAAPRVAL